MNVSPHISGRFIYVSIVRVGVLTVNLRVYVTTVTHPVQADSQHMRPQGFQADLTENKKIQKYHNGHQISQANPGVIALETGGHFGTLCQRSCVEHQPACQSYILASRGAG